MAESSRYLLTMPTGLPTLLPSAPRKMAPVSRLGILFVAALLVPALSASSAAASPATYGGISADGKVAVFSSDEGLVSGDTDHERDVYERSYDEALERYVTREVSIGPSGGNDALPAQYDAVSADGNAVFFSTKEPLVAADQDNRTDIYMRDLLGAGTTTLISAGAAACESSGCGNGAFDASFAPGGLAPDGEELFFVSSEKLSPADKDGSPDIYMRDLGDNTTTLVSRGAANCEAQGCGDKAFGVSFNAVSADGSTVVFSSNEPLAEEDVDTLQDVYVRDLGAETTRLASTPGVCAGGVDCKAVFGGVSSNGSHVFFESSERISAADQDESQDVYDWTPGGGAALASIGSLNGNGAFNATYGGSSTSGGAVFFETSESLDASDGDGARDVYERTGGVTTVVSTGPTGGNGDFNASLRWVSPQGASPAVAFTTDEQLTSADTDGSQDVYRRSGGVTSLVSSGSTGGNGPFDAAFAGASRDGSHFFFISSEALVAEDEDASPDIYASAGGATTLISTGPEGGDGAFSSGLAGVSEDGTRAFFTTEERLTEGDPDAELDVYERAAAITRLVSVGNLLALGPVAPTLTATNPASPGASLTPSIVGQAAAGTWVKLYKTFDCAGEPVAQGTDAELGSPGLAVSVAAGSTTSFRATAEAGGLVSPCSASISYKQETPPPPPPPVEEQGSGGGGGTTGSGSGGGTGSGAGGAGGGSKAHGGVQLVTPQTLITFGPASKTRKRKVVFRFADATGQPGTDFSCKLDRHRWVGCGSPKQWAKLKLGRHVFAVKSVNAAGVWDEAPAKRSFKVVR
jgi:Tol biopolymer transport system component